MKSMKRAFALFLALIMCVGLLPASAFGEGNGKRQPETTDPVYYTVTLDANGGTWADAGMQTSFGCPANGTFGTPTADAILAPQGMELVGWSDGSHTYGFDASIVVTGDFTLSAVWRALPADLWVCLGDVELFAYALQSTKGVSSADSSLVGVALPGYYAGEDVWYAPIVVGCALSSNPVSVALYDAGGSVIATRQVAVVAAPDTGAVSISADSLSLVTGAAGTLNLRIPADYAGALEVDWRSDDEKVATLYTVPVTVGGRTFDQCVVCAAGAGETRIVATVDGVEYPCTVSVSAPAASRGPVRSPDTTYTVTLDINGGTWVDSSMQTSYSVAENEQFELPDSTTFTPPQNMTLECWYDENDGSWYWGGDLVEITADVTFTAQWISVYEVTFDPGEGTWKNTGTGEVRTEYYPDGDGFSFPYASALDAPAGMKLAGWKENTNDQYLPGDWYDVWGAASFEAIWIDENSTISIDWADCSSLYETIVMYVGRDPVYIGVDIYPSIASNQNVNCWSTNPDCATIDFDLSYGGNGYLTIEPLAPGSTTVWAELDETGDQIFWCNIIVVGQMDEGLSYMSIEESWYDLWVGDVLYPAAEAIVNGSSVYPSSVDLRGTVLSSADESVIVPMTDGNGRHYFCAIDEGYTTVTWSSANGLYSVSWDVSVTNGVETTVTLSYDANGGVGAPDEQEETSYDTFKSFEVSDVVPTLNGYDFLGWSFDPDDDTEPVYQAGEWIDLDCDATLYAVWGHFTVTLSYDANGGVGAPDEQEETSYDTFKSFEVSDVVPTLDGYDFLGWSFDPDDDTAPLYQAGEWVDLDCDDTLYAVWGHFTTVTLSYDANGGDNAPAAYVISDADVTKCFTVSYVEPSRDGYDFLGWSFDRYATDADYVAGDDVYLDCDDTLYAVWDGHSEIKEGFFRFTDAAGNMIFATPYKENGEYADSCLDTVELVYSDSAASGCGVGNYTLVSEMRNVNDHWEGDGSSLKTIRIDCAIKLAGSVAVYFSHLSSLETISGLNNLDTSDVTSMYAMFSDCHSLTSLDLSGFDTSGVTNMDMLFFDCYALTDLNLSGWETGSVTNMSSMFSDCHSLTSLDLSGFDTSSLTRISAMFDGCGRLTSLNLSGWDTSGITDMSYLFRGCQSLTSLNLSGFVSSSVTNLRYMFFNCKALTNLDLSGWDTSSVTNMSYMFYGCRAMTSLDLSGFDTSSVTDMSLMFSGCSGLTSLGVSGFTTNNVTTMWAMFDACESLTSLDLSGWNTGSVTSMSGMFYNCYALTSLGVSGFDTSSVTDMSYMFYNCRALTSMDLSAWSTSSVTDMSYMFYDCRALTSLNLSGWSGFALTVMNHMFASCASLTELDLSALTAAGSNDYYEMFSGMSALKKLTVGDGFNSGTYKAEAPVTLYRILEYGNSEFTAGTRLDSGGAVYVVGYPIVVGDTTYHVFYGQTAVTLPDAASLGDSRTLRGYALTQGASDPDFGQTVTYDEVYQLTGYASGSEVTLYPVWSKTVTLSYDANGGSNAPEGQTITDAADTKSFIVTDQEPGRDGYEFQGWSFDQYAADADYVAGDTVNLDADDILYAVWHEITSVTLSYDANGGNGAPSDYTVTDANTVKTFTVSYTRPYRDGYDFLGWSFDENAVDPDYQAGSWVELSASATLYAVWREHRIYTVTLIYPSGAREERQTEWGFSLPRYDEHYSHYEGRRLIWTLVDSNLSPIPDGEGKAQEFAGDAYIDAPTSDMFFLGAWRWETVTITYIYADTAEAFQEGDYESETISVDYGTEHVLRDPRAALNSAGAPFRWWLDLYSSTKCSAGTTVTIYADRIYLSIYEEVLVGGDISDDTHEYGVLWYVTDACELVFEPYDKTTGELVNEGWMGDLPDAKPWDPWVDQIVSSRFVNTVHAGSDISNMYGDCEMLRTVDFTGFDTSGTTDMCCMFHECESLVSIDLSVLDTSSVVDMSEMFSGCRQLGSVTFGGSFDTSNVTDMTVMFAYCSSLRSIDLSELDTGSVTSMEEMFRRSGLRSIDLSVLDTHSVTTMEGMFDNCDDLKSVTLGTLDTSSLNNTARMFSSTQIRMLDMSGFDTSNVTDVRSMLDSWTLSTVVFGSSFAQTTNYVLSGSGWYHVKDADGNDLDYQTDGSYQGSGDGRSVTNLSSDERAGTWTRVVVVWFYPNNGEDSWVEYHFPGEVITLPDVTPKSGEVFLHWHHHSYDDDNCHYSPAGAQITIRSDLSFDAEYAPKTVTARFVADGETVETRVLDMLEIQADGIVMPDGPQKAGYSLRWELLSSEWIWEDQTIPMEGAAVCPISFSAGANALDEMGSVVSDALATLALRQMKIMYQSEFGGVGDAGIDAVFNEIFEESDCDYHAVTQRFPRGENESFEDYVRRVVEAVSGRSFELEIMRLYGFDLTNSNPNEISGEQYLLLSLIETLTDNSNNGEIVFTAVYDPLPASSVTLSYDANGGAGAPEAQTLTNTDAVKTFTVSSTEPTRDGYVFLGWALDENATAAEYAAGGSISLSADATLYAVWGEQPTTVTLSYDAHGGTGAPASEALTNTDEEKVFTVTATEPVRAGYDFLGWSLDADATAAGYTAGDSISLSADATLYAVWAKQATTITLSYDANGGTGAPPAYSVTNTDIAKRFTVTYVVPSLEGYEFAGWASDPNAAEAWYLPGAKIFLTEDTTLYAVWTLPQGPIPTPTVTTITLSYDANGGTGAPPAYKVSDEAVSKNFTVSYVTPKREGYDFLGWAFTADSAEAWYLPGAVITLSADATLYAVWKVKTTAPDNAEQNTPDTTPPPVIVRPTTPTPTPTPTETPATSPAAGQNTPTPADNINETPPPLAGPGGNGGLGGEEIGDGTTPLANVQKEKGWSLASLLFAIANVVMGALAVAQIMSRKVKDEVEQALNKTRLLTLIPTLGALVTLLLTSDFTGSMKIANVWSLVELGLLAANVGIEVFLRMKSRKLSKTA